MLQSYSINLVVKAKAINQWMECTECRLQQVKTIEVKFPEDRQCVHCHSHNLKEIPIYFR